MTHREPPDCPYVTITMLVTKGLMAKGQPVRTYVHTAAHWVMIGWARPRPNTGPKAVERMIDRYEAWHRKIGFTPAQAAECAKDLRDELAAWRETQSK